MHTSEASSHSPQLGNTRLKYEYYTSLSSRDELRIVLIGGGFSILIINIITTCGKLRTRGDDH